MFFLINLEASSKPCDVPCAYAHLNTLLSCFTNILIQVIVDGTQNTWATWVKLLCATVAFVVYENTTLNKVVCSLDDLLKAIVVLVW